MRQSEKLRQIGLGVQLRKMREKSGMTTRSVAASLGLSSSSVNRTELGLRAPNREEVSALCALYGVTGDEKRETIERAGTKSETTAWLGTRHAPDQLASLLVLEREAVAISNLQVALIPGLVQTTDYARLVLGPSFEDADLERTVSIRLGRQAVLSRANPPAVSLLVEEAALRRTLGSARMMREQLEQLLIVRRRDNVSIRVVPSNAGPALTTGAPFAMYELSDGTTYVFLEANHVGVFLTEPADVKPFMEVFRCVETFGLNEQDSGALIRKIAEELSDE